jgi:hypothetical protein
MSKNTFTLPVNNANELFTAEFGNAGKERKICMYVFYDYRQIKLKIDGQSTYNSSYIFSIGNNESITFDFYLENLKRDSSSHKLLVCFTTGYGMNEKDLDARENRFGINTLYDLYYTENSDSTNKFSIPKDINMEVPKYVYNDFISAAVIINMDFQSDKIEQQLIEYPPKLINAKPNQSIDMMYNISNEEAQNAIMILMVEYKQTEMETKEYLFVDLKNSQNSVSKDRFKFNAPQKPGIYEIFSIVVYNPFEKSSETGNIMPDYSYRSTLVVE